MSKELDRVAKPFACFSILMSIEKRTIWVHTSSTHAFAAKHANSQLHQFQPPISFAALSQQLGIQSNVHRFQRLGDGTILLGAFSLLLEGFFIDAGHDSFGI